MSDNSLQTVSLISEGVECVPGVLTSSMRILIKDLNTNTTITLEVQSHFTIQQIKHLIHDKKNIPIKLQNIIFKDGLLQNQLALSYYDITNDSVLHLLTNNNQSSNATDDPHIFEEQKQSTTLNEDPLAKLLEDHALYDVLYSKFIKNQIDLEALRNDLPQNEINSFCDEFNLNTTQKVKFRGLMRSLYKRNNPDSEMTVILVGDMNAGKTCLIRKYTENTYTEYNISTIGVDHSIITESLGDDSSMKITLWDTAGQERFRSVCIGYYRKADCVIICYDSLDERTLESSEYWRTQVDNYANNEVVILLVGCKADEANELNIFKKAQSIIEQPQWAKFNAICFECSAKTGNNVKNVFLAAAELVLMNRPTTEEKPNHQNVDQLKEEKVKKETSKCCD